MAVFRLTRFTINSTDAAEMLAKRAALVTAIRDRFPGLTEARLAKVDDQTWIDIWRWDSIVSAQAAIAATSTVPEAAAAFSLANNVTAEFAEVVDER